MGENIIRTRQTAKIATSSEWGDSTLPLKRGELTINETTGEMRFGDGVDTFNNSPKVKTVPLSHSSSSTEYGVGNGENYGHIRLSDSTSSTSGVSGGTAATSAAVKAAYDLANSKANKFTGSGGFEGGMGSSIGNGTGGAVGYETTAHSGGAVGDTVSAYDGGAIGYFAKSNDGAAVGKSAKTGDGVAIGKEAKTVDSSNNGIDAIQLGTGTNNTAKTMQVYNYQLMNASGKIPADRLSSHASTATTYGVGNSSSYGHLKLSASTSSTSGTSSGIAATPSAVKAAYDLANGKAPTSHASSSTTYGIGNGLYYGHVSLSDSLDMGTDSDYGIAATPMAVKTVYMQLLSQLADKYNAAVLVDTATSISTGKYQNYSSPFEDADGNKLKVVIYAPKLTSIAGLSIRDTDDIVAIIAPQLKSIATQAFWGCHYLQFLYIPSTITSIGSNAFAYCDHLKSIYIDKEEGSISGAPWQTTGVSVENVYWLGGA